MVHCRGNCNRSASSLPMRARETRYTKFTKARRAGPSAPTINGAELISPFAMTIDSRSGGGSQRNPIRQSSTASS